MILTVAYAVYLVAYFLNASSTVGGMIATALVTPHIVCVVLAGIFSILGFFGKKRWAFLVTGILLVVSAVVFLTYAGLVVIQAIFAFIAYARMGVSFE